MILITSERCAACELIKEMFPGIATRKFQGLKEIQKYKGEIPILIDGEFSVTRAANIIQYLRQHGYSKNTKSSTGPTT